MAFHKRQKISRARGSRTHGWGRLHRGSGNKGGAGHAGSGKKADGKKPHYADRVFGRHGFVAQNHQVEQITINLKDIEQQLAHWIAQKHAVLTAGVATIDLSKLGFTKLLGDGRVTHKLHVTVTSASEKAVEKVKAAGGTVAVTA